ncbi:MAG: glycoside hydrolase family 43 protein [Polyangiales bacterium]
MPSYRLLALVSASLVACSSGDTVDDTPASESGIEDAIESDTATGAADAIDDATDSGAVADTPAADAPVMTPCTTRITYGNAWVHGPSHPDSFDDAMGAVTWDGVCTDDGANSYAVLSNGWKPYFNGHSACVIALDAHCGGKPACTTRVTYGSTWLHGPGHPAQYDEVPGRVTWNGDCRASGGDRTATLSNGWGPTFSGSECPLSFEYRDCGGLYENPVVDVDCPDPGVLVDGSTYVMACTSGGAADAFPIRTSKDLVSWKSAGHIFPSANKPTWAKGDFWAPEIHKVGKKYVAYFSARHTSGVLSIGAASSDSATGPFTDIGAPLLHDASMGLIDVNEFEAPDGSRYLLWKEDGNAVGKPTPVHVQKLAADGLSLVGSRITAITNDRGWEGSLVEGPWMIEHGGTYYLFYSANGYASSAYAIGVARSSSPMGTFEKLATPILTSGGAWAGPGHCSVVDLPDGETEVVYHAWKSGKIGAAPGRLMLVDRVVWSGGWPAVPGAPSSISRPMP